MCPGECDINPAFNPSSDTLPKLPLSMCQATTTVQCPSVGALRKTQGQAAAQLQASKYVPVTFQDSVTVFSFVRIGFVNNSGATAMGQPGSCT